MVLSTLYAAGRRVIYPSIPRVTQTKGSGMTYTTNPITNIYQSYIHENNFNQNGLSSIGRSFIQFFDLPGTSAWSNHGPSIEYYVVLSSVVMFIILICIARKKILKISKRNSRYLKFRVKRED